jgi:hypothetical protein
VKRYHSDTLVVAAHEKGDSEVAAAVNTYCSGVTTGNPPEPSRLSAPVHASFAGCANATADDNDAVRRARRREVLSVMAFLTEQG